MYFPALAEDSASGRIGLTVISLIIFMKQTTQTFTTSTTVNTGIQSTLTVYALTCLNTACGTIISDTYLVLIIM